VALLAARECRIRRLKEENPEWDVANIRARLVAYSSGKQHICFVL
jgi:hypothetical protein